MPCDESLAFAFAAFLLIFVVFYVLSIETPDKACFSAPSPADRYSYIDKSSNWSGLDDSDKTVEMDITKGRMLVGQESPISMTTTRKLVDQEYGKTY